MLGKGDLWAGFGFLAALITGGLGAVVGLMLFFQEDVSDRFNRIDQHQLQQTEKLGELNGTLRYVQAVDERRVAEVMTAMGHNPAAHDTQRAHVYLTQSGASDGDLLDLSHANAADLTSMVSTYRVGDQEMRCVQLREMDSRAAFLCAPRAAAREGADDASRGG